MALNKIKNSALALVVSNCLIGNAAQAYEV